MKEFLKSIINVNTIVVLFYLMTAWMLFEAIYYVRHNGEFYFYKVIDKLCDKYEARKRKREERKRKSEE